MKKLLNTLYVTTQGAYLSKDGETVSVSIEKEVRLRVPVHTLGGIVCFGNVLCSPFLMGFCAESGVGLSFLTEYGRFLARIQGKASGNVLLRREQYRKADNEHFCANIARSMLAGKIANCRTVLQRSVRDHNEKIDVEEIASVSRLMGNYISRLETCAGLDIIRGMEGDAARNYFSVFNQLITAQKDDFVFHERNRRPPLDNVNCLLSFIYTLLMHDVRSALECVGLDPAVGFLHSDRPGRAGLALDMMEEFRPFIADRLALSLINLRQVQAKGFIRTETGAVLMDDATRKTVLVAYQERKREEMLHPFIDEKIQIGLLFHVQAMLLARYLRGDLDGYPPFIWK
jgi:CRISPR-associated protein Cas1